MSVADTVGAARSNRGESRIQYLARVARVYTRPNTGPLSFWHEIPEVNDAAFTNSRYYFMRFRQKAGYRGPFDQSGIPLLNYHGHIGVQYNPIAIAQYGLARFNRWCDFGAMDDRAAWLTAANWLARTLRPNTHGVLVWMHEFDFPYRQTLRAPWYSGLAQGTGVSLLVRAARETGDPELAEAAKRAFEALTLPVSDGGVSVRDERGHLWIEEYVVTPPSHILNGFMWALWGVYDYARTTSDTRALDIWSECVQTLRQHLGWFDTGWWSLYEAPNTGQPMLASPYYHRLHVVQLHVMHRLTGDEVFLVAAERFTRYSQRRVNRARAIAQKAWFKIRNY